MTLTQVHIGFLSWLAVLGGMPAAHASELVEVAKHRAAVVPEHNDTTPPLFGFLSRPNGPGRFPAVILLHGCTGFSEHDTAFAAALRSWGYVSLALDSLGAANVCVDKAAAGAGAEAADAFAGLRYLTAQGFVASARVAVMGWSMGGDAAFAAVETGGVWHTGEARFAAMAAYYPNCAASTGILTVPALVLIGERDDWTPAPACRKLAAHENDVGVTRDASKGTPIDLVVYPNATHGFDYVIPTQRYLGYLIQYDETAARDAETRVREFLRRVIGDHPESP